MMRKFLDSLATALVIISVSILTITFSIGLPIYFRPFYYMQIEPLGIEEATGFDRETVIEGYDEVLDYLTRPGGSFSAGEFKFSEEGASHFEDCKGLFTLNAVAYVFSAVVLIAVLILHKRGCVKVKKPLGIPTPLLSGALTLTLFAVLGVLVAIDFDTAFRVFHTVFFPGKDNWLFNPRYDEIILAMPEKFFMNCAILIGSSVIILSVLLIVSGLIYLKRKKVKH